MKNLSILCILLVLISFKSEAQSENEASFERAIIHQSQQQEVPEKVAKRIDLNSPVDIRTAETAKNGSSNSNEPKQYFTEHEMEEGETIFDLMKRNGFDPNNPKLVDTIFYYNGLDNNTARTIPAGAIVLLPAANPNLETDTVTTTQASISSMTTHKKNKKQAIDIFLGARRYSLSEKSETLEDDYSDAFIGVRYNRKKFSAALIKEGLYNNNEDEFHHDKGELRLGYKVYSNNKLKGVTAYVSKTVNKYTITKLNLSPDLDTMKTDLNSLGVSLDFNLPSEKLNLQVNVSKPFSTSGTSSSKTFGKELEVASLGYIEAILAYNANESMSIFAMFSKQKEEVEFSEGGAELQFDSSTSKMGVQFSF